MIQTTTSGPNAKQTTLFGRALSRLCFVFDFAPEEADLFFGRRARIPPLPIGSVCEMNGAPTAHFSADSQALITTIIIIIITIIMFSLFEICPFFGNESRRQCVGEQLL